MGFFFGRKNSPAQSGWYRGWAFKETGLRDEKGGMKAKLIFFSVFFLVLLSSLAPLSVGFLAPTNPPWHATYDLRASTICMAVNSSGWFNVSRAANFGVVSYDWSNAKAQWVNARPMDWEQRLLAQATATKLAAPQARVFVYRNLVKALPWFSSVRTILTDPQYEGVFLKFRPL